MIKKLLSLFLSLFIFVQYSYALTGQEQIVDTAKEEAAPIANEEIRKLKKDVQDTSDSVAAVDVLTTQGDTLYHNGIANARLAAGTAGQFFKTLGAGANPLWADVADALGTVLSAVKFRAARFTGGAAPALQGGGIGGTHTAVQNATGDYTITWAGTAFATAHYKAVCTIETLTGGDGFCIFVSRTTTTIRVRFITSGGAAADPDYFDVIALGT